MANRHMPAKDSTHSATMRGVGLPVALAIVQLILAYEWLVSGINKLLNMNFTVQLEGTLRSSLAGNPCGWYVDFLRSVVLPHPMLFGVLSEVGETVIGITLLVSAVLWLRRPSSTVTHYAAVAASFALAGAAFLSLNYFFQGGSPLPVINPSNAFNEGIDIDILIPLLSVTVLIANLREVKAAWRQRLGSPSRPDVSVRAAV